MPKLNRTRLALLGFLTWRPMSGYDLKKAIEGSISNFWSESYGQIYPILKRLGEEGLVTSARERSPGGRSRNVYSITEAGRAALSEWLAEPVPRQTLRNELLLKLFFGRRGDLDWCIEHVERCRRRQLENRERYARIREALESGELPPSEVPFWLITLRSGQLDAESQIAWCDETLETLDALRRREQEGHGST